MQYLTDSGHKFSLSYSKLKQDYENYRNMSDEEFYSDIPKLLHFTVFVSYFKELPTSVVLADDGIIHELVHKLNDIDLCTHTVDFRELWNNLMRL